MSVSDVFVFVHLLIFRFYIGRKSAEFLDPYLYERNYVLKETTGPNVTISYMKAPDGVPYPNLFAFYGKLLIACSGLYALIMGWLSKDTLSIIAGAVLLVLGGYQAHVDYYERKMIKDHGLMKLVFIKKELSLKEKVLNRILRFRYEVFIKMDE